MYVELLTRISTQYLQPASGDETTAIDGIFTLFALTRETLKKQGRHCNEFARIAIAVLNQANRPFTAKWHKQSQAGAFDDEICRKAFRKELSQLQKQIRNYTKMLADMANVEDLTELE